MQRLSLLTAVAVLLLAASGAYAFEIQRGQTNGDGSAKFADPDSVTEGMANHLSGDNAGGTNFFGSRLQLQGSSGSSGNGYGMSPAMQDRFMGGADSIGHAYTAPR